MIYCYPTLKVLKHEYRISRNAINFPASCMCSSTIKRFAKETFFVYIVHILHFTTDIIQRKMYIWTTFLQILWFEMELFAFLWHCSKIVIPIWKCSNLIDLLTFSACRVIFHTKNNARESFLLHFKQRVKVSQCTWELRFE